MVFNVRGFRCSDSQKLCVLLYFSTLLHKQQLRVIFIFHLVPIASCLLLEHCALIKLCWF